MKHLAKNFKILNSPFYLLILLIIFFFPVLFLNKTLFFRDITAYDYPLISYIVKILKNGEIPLWDPYIFSGFPQMASLEPAVFYPGIILFLILPFHLALGFSLLIHYFIGGFGIYLIGRNWKLSPTSCLIGAVVFTFNSYCFELNSVYYILFAVSWIPYIFLYVEKNIEQLNLKNLLLLILFSVLLLSTGRLDYFYFFLIFIFFWIIFRFIKTNYTEKKSFILKIISICFAFGLAIGIMAIQILPAIEFVKTTKRGLGVNLEASINWALHPLQLIQIIFSNFFGTLYDEVGIYKIIYPNFLVYNLYIGLPALLLCIYGINFKDHKSILFFIIFFLFTIISFGNITPLYGILYHYLPLFNSLRFPIKMFIIPVFSLGLLASLGAENLLKNKKGIETLSKITYQIFCIFIISIFLFNNVLVNWLNNHYLIQLKNIDFILKSVLQSLLFFTIFMIIIKTKLDSLKILNLIIILISIELLITNWQNILLVNKDELYKVSKFGGDIQKMIDEPGLYRIIRPIYFGKYKLAESEIFSEFRYNIENIGNNLPITYGLQNAYGYYPGEPLRISVVIDCLNDEIPGLKISNKIKAKIMRMMGVRFYIWNIYNKFILPPDKDNFSLIKNYPENGLQLYELKNFQPKFSFKTKALVTNSDQDILKAIFAPDSYGFDEKSVVLMNDSAYKQAINKIKKGYNNEIKKIDIKLIKEENTQLIIKANVPETGYLVIANRYDPDWNATIDNEPTPILQANYFQQAIRVNVGENLIQMTYSPKSFQKGKKISMIILLFIFFVSIIILWKNQWKFS
jgi:hypothetical protein